MSKAPALFREVPFDDRVGDQTDLRAIDELPEPFKGRRAGRGWNKWLPYNAKAPHESSSGIQIPHLMNEEKISGISIGLGLFFEDIFENICKPQR